MHYASLKILSIDCIQHSTPSAPLSALCFLQGTEPTPHLMLRAVVGPNQFPMFPPQIAPANPGLHLTCIQKFPWRDVEPHLSILTTNQLHFFSISGGQNVPCLEP